MRLNHPAVRLTLGLLLSMLAGAALFYSHLSETLDRRVLDRQFALLRQHFPHPVRQDVVIVGIDERSVSALREHYSLWHPHLARFFQVMAGVKPAVLGIGIPLPEHSFEALPHYDQLLVQGVTELRAQSPIVLAETTDEFGKPRPILPALLKAAGEEALALQTLCADEDGVVRRFAPARCMVNPQRPSLEESMAAWMGVRQHGEGLIDFTLGQDWEYVSFVDVLAWAERGEREKLSSLFAGKPVLLGIVSPLGDRVRAPLPILAGEPLNHAAPSIMLHGQILRAMLNRGLLREQGRTPVLVLTMLAALFWFGRPGLAKTLLFITLPLLLLAYSSVQLWYGGYLPIGGILLSATAAFLLRWVYEIGLQMRQRRALRDIFRNYVSEEILEKILSGKLRASLHQASKKRICVLTADIHGFTARMEKMPPEELVALLNDYFSEMTIAIYKHHGTLDKFIGDGLVAFFGAPLPLESPEKSALEAAQEMLVRLRELNNKLAERGVERLKISIGLHAGLAVVGHIGSEQRQDYTALGNVVALASAIGALGKRVDFPVLCSDEVARVAGHAGNLVDLGEQLLDGQQSMHVYGWLPPLLAES